MSNVFKSTPVYFFQVPQELFDRPVWAGLKPAAMRLYLYLCYKSQAISRAVFQPDVEEVKRLTGLSDNSLGSARKELRKAKLAESTLTKAGFVYEILDPFTGKSLEQIVDFNDLRSDQLEDYFLHHLSDYGPSPDENGIRFKCPFHMSKERDRDLSVKLFEGGLWNCFNDRCHKRGKLIAFERAMADKRGQPISTTEAHHRIIAVIQQADQRRRIKKAQEIEENCRLAGIY